MINEISEIAGGAQQVDRAVRNVKAKHVNERTVKDLIRIFVQQYFTTWRPKLVDGFGAEEELVALDSALQNLLRHAQRRVSVQEYRATVKLITEQLRELELRSLLIPSQTRSQFEPQQTKILKSLRTINDSAAKSYEQGLIDLQWARAARGVVQRSSSEKPCVKFLTNWLRMLKLKLRQTSNVSRTQKVLR